MKTILYGNDIHLEWGFTDAVTGLNFDFAGVDIKLTLFSCNKVLPVDNYTQEGGTINAIIPTKCMPCGVYTAECEYSVGMGVKRAKVRINDAFQISNNKPWHHEEGITPCEMHEMETVYLHSIAMPIITSKIAMIEYLSGNRYNELKENDCLKKRTIYVVEKEGEKADMYLYKYPLSSGSIPGTIDWDDIQNKPDIPEPYVLPVAEESALGGIKASPKTENETTEVKIGEDGKLYAPEISKIRMATENELGGIKASPKTDCDTVEIKIGEDGKLYGKKGVGGNPDNEDLCLSTNSDGEKVLKFNNKSYDASSFSGLGRVYLRKNIVSDKNKLSQDMINSLNTIYIIQYDYDLAGGTINIPSNCVLDFQGGSISNGSIIFADSRLVGHVNFSNVTYDGTIVNESVDMSWFGIDNTGAKDVTNILYKLTNDVLIECDNFKLSGTYLVNSNAVSINRGSGHSVKLYGGGIFKVNSSTHVNDIISLTADYATLEDITIDASLSPQEQWDVSDFDSMVLVYGILISASKGVRITNVNLHNIWGYGIRVYGAPSSTEVDGLFANNVGGKWSINDVNDSFGDIFYFYTGDKDSNISLRNVYGIGKYNSYLDRPSRIGVTIENLDDAPDNKRNVNVIMDNCTFRNFNRGVHIEGVKNTNVNIGINNSELSNMGVVFFEFNNPNSILKVTTNSSKFICGSNDYNTNNSISTRITELRGYNSVFDGHHYNMFMGGSVWLENCVLEIRPAACHVSNVHSYNTVRCTYNIHGDIPLFAYSSWGKIEKARFKPAIDDVVYDITGAFGRIYDTEFINITGTIYGYLDDKCVAEVPKNKINDIKQYDIQIKSEGYSGDKLVLGRFHSETFKHNWDNYKNMDQTTSELIPEWVNMLPYQDILYLVMNCYDGNQNYSLSNADNIGNLNLYVLTLKRMNGKYTPIHTFINTDTGNGFKLSCDYDNNTKTMLNWTSVIQNVILTRDDLLSLFPAGDFYSLVYYNGWTPYSIKVEEVTFVTGVSKDDSGNIVTTTTTKKLAIASKLADPLI